MRSKYANVLYPAMNDTFVVFDSQSDQQDEKIISALGQMLSGQLNCSMLAILNHDDDILWYQLYSGGKLQDGIQLLIQAIFDGSEPSELLKGMVTRKNPFARLSGQLMSIKLKKSCAAHSMANTHSPSSGTMIW